VIGRAAHPGGGVVAANQRSRRRSWRRCLSHRTLPLTLWRRIPPILNKSAWSNGIDEGARRPRARRQRQVECHGVVAGVV